MRFYPRTSLSDEKGRTEQIPVTNEYSEPGFNAATATLAVLQPPANQNGYCIDILPRPILHCLS